MKHVAVTATALGALVAALCTGCGSGGGGSSSSSDTPSASASGKGPATVSTRSGGLGDILVDGNGRTLYLFVADTSTKSTCDGSCAQAWPPLLTSGKPKASHGAKANLLGTTKRDDGGTEVTYNGHPLYLYQGDSKAGDTTGKGLNQFGALWWVLDTGGNKITKKGGGTGGY